MGKKYGKFYQWCFLLSLLGLVFSIYFQSNSFIDNYVNKKIEAYQEHIYSFEDEFQRVFYEISDLSKQNKLNLAQILKYNKEEFTILYYLNDEMTYWSNRSFVPEDILNRIRENGEDFIPFDDDTYYINSKSISESERLFFIRSMSVDNFGKYESLFHHKQLLSIDQEITSDIHAKVYNKYKEVLGYFNKTPETYSTIYLEISWIIFILFLTISSVLWVKSINQGSKQYSRSLLMLPILFFIKEVIKTDTFQALAEFSLVKQSIYANPHIGVSLLILLVNLLFFLILIFFWYSDPLPVWIKESKKDNYKLFGFILIVFVGAFCLFAYTNRSIIIDSGDVIIFEPTATNYSLIISFLMYLVSTFFIMFIVRMARLIMNSFSRKWLYYLYTMFIILTATTLLLSVFNLQETLFHLIWVSLTFLAVFYLIDNDSQQVIDMSGFIVLILLSSIYAAGTVRNYSQTKSENQLKLLTRQVAQDNDDLIEFLFNNIVEEIENDPVINRLFSSPIVSDQSIANRIQSVYFTDDFNDYSLSFSFNHDLDSLPKTSYVERYFYYDKFDYNGVIPIVSQLDSTLLQINIQKPKLIANSTFYTNYLHKNSNNYFNNRDLSFAFYRNGKVRFVKGNIEVDDWEKYLDLDVGEFATLNLNQNMMLIYKRAEEDLIAMYINENVVRNNLFYLITNFFAVFAFGYILMIILATRFEITNASFFRNSLANQIQYLALAILFLAGLIVAIFSASSIKKGVRSVYNRDMLEQVNTIVNQFSKQEENRDIQGAQYTSNFEQYLKREFENVDFDIEYFSQFGDLIYTNNDILFTDRVWPKKANPYFVNQFQTEPSIQYLSREKVVDHTFTGFYHALRNDEWDLLGFIYLPAFDIDQQIRKQSGMITYSEYNILTLILFVLTFLALFMTQTLTRLLNNIRKRLSKVDINTNLQPIEWSSSDEIGLLVKEYNTMVKKLDESAILLARSERESAWRDVAKQVAHEIKNPLTPMKLSIQHLKRQVKSDEGVPAENVVKTLDILDNQINHLSVIADNFSSISKLEVPNMKKMDLLESLRENKSIFDSSENYDFKCYLHSDESPKWIYADDTMINRVFTNILKNAVQALVPERKGLIEIEFLEEEKNYILLFHDNGKGIPLENRAKIFTPNFTTKSSGTGIGLMMSKKIIELHNGTLNFESTPDQGTTFIMYLPKFTES